MVQLHPRGFLAKHNGLKDSTRPTNAIPCERDGRRAINIGVRALSQCRPGRVGIVRNGDLLPWRGLEIRRPNGPAIDRLCSTALRLRMLDVRLSGRAPALVRPHTGSVSCSTLFQIQTEEPRPLRRIRVVPVALNSRVREVGYVGKDGELRRRRLYGVGHGDGDTARAHDDRAVLVNRGAFAQDDGVVATGERRGEFAPHGNG